MILLLGYNADVICLQEVDTKIFLLDFLPQFEAEFDGQLKTKGQTPEGSAIFYRKDKFELIDQCDVTLRDELSKSEHHKELWEKISNTEALKGVMDDRSTILQVICCII